MFNPARKEPGVATAAAVTARSCMNEQYIESEVVNMDQPERDHPGYVELC
jgi:hypothetical protein